MKSNGCFARALALSDSLVCDGNFVCDGEDVAVTCTYR